MMRAVISTILLCCASSVFSVSDIQNNHSRFFSHDHQVVAVLHTGSLKENLTHVAKQYGWQQVVWDLPNDYNWVGNTQIRTKSLQKLFEHILSRYPVQAAFYQGNHVLVFRSRTV